MKYNEITVVIREMKNNKIDYLFLLYQLIYFAGTIKYLISDASLLFNLAASVIFLIYKGKMIDLKLVAILIAVLVINSFAYFYTNSFDPNLILGIMIRISIAYIIIKAYGKKFIQYFENLVFILAIIGFVFYIIQLVRPEWLQAFKFISFTTARREQAGHINLILYHYNTWGTFRNGGFMWEAAAYGAVLSWAITINIYKNNFKFTLKFIILIISMITTFSLGAYSCLLVFLVAYFFENKLSKIVIVFAVLAGILVATMNFGIFKSNFSYMFEKYEHYEDSTSIENALNAKHGRVSRTSGFLLDMKYFKNWPFGYGSIKENKYYNMARSPNGFGRYIIAWGILGLVFLVKSYLKYLVNLKAIYNSRLKFHQFYLLIFILTLNGNPIDRAPFFLAFLIIGIISNYRIPESGTENLMISSLGRDISTRQLH